MELGTVAYAAERAYELEGGDRIVQGSFDAVVGDGRASGLEELALVVLLDLNTCFLAPEYITTRRVM